MFRKNLPLLALTVASLACAVLIPSQPTEEPGTLPTSAALTATALLPAFTPAPVDTSAPPATEAPPATATAAPFVCALAYADAGNLFCLGDDGTPRVLATGSQIYDPRLSSDGAHVAYQVPVAEGISQLWVVSAAGGDARLLVSAEQVPNADPARLNSPGYFEWLAGTRTLLFDTRYTPTGGPFGPGEYLNADLWSVDAVTGAIAAVLPAGSAGAFRASPDGQTVAVSRPQGLDLVNANGGNYRQNVITFPSIVTYSEYQYRPLPQWSADGTFFNVAIPSPDPMAPDVRVDFYRIGVDGIVQPLANVPANIVFGGALNPPRFSPNGQFAAYSLGQADGSGEALHLIEFIPGGSLADRPFDPRPGLQGWGWSPDSSSFAYTVIPGGAPGQGYVTGPAPGAERLFGAGLTALRALEWLDPGTLVYLGQLSGGDWALYRQPLGGEPTLLASGLSLQASLDVRD